MSKTVKKVLLSEGQTPLKKVVTTEFEEKMLGEIVEPNKITIVENTVGEDEQSVDNTPDDLQEKQPEVVVPETIEELHDDVEEVKDVPKVNYSTENHHY
jgi:hypothetical protein